MEPLLPPKSETNYRRIHDECYDHILRLCTSAFKLTLQLRRCKEVYRCLTPVQFSPLDTEEVEPQYSEPFGDESAANKVLYVLFGMLVKYPEHNPMNKTVLEKAHVVVRD